MFIKQISIQGFKSYKETTSTEELSPHHNVIVGRNGSGKSNFFAAIRFLLNDSYSRMTQEERQSLLHESTGIATLSAYVECVFDNSDNRFPTGRDTLVLRRTIGLKKDEYTIDRKTASKTEVENLLTAAGFSRANPYYIVPQGRITWLTGSKASERLSLLKEVAGTSVYEENRKESMRLIEESEWKRGKIDEMLTYIDERIEELSSEKEILSAYLEADKEKRICEFISLTRQLETVQMELQQLDSTCADELDASEKIQEKIESLHMQINTSESALAREKNSINFIEGEIARLESEKSTLLRERAQLEMSEEASVSTSQSSSHSILVSLKEKLQKKRHELQNSIIPALLSKEQAESELRSKIALLETDRDLATEQLARSKAFKGSESERKAWLLREIDENSQAISSETARQSQIKQEIEASSKEFSQISLQISQLEEQIQEQTAKIIQLRSNPTSSKANRNLLNEKRKETWKSETLLSSELALKRSELEKVEKTLALQGDRSAISALLAVQQIAKELGFTSSQVHGPLFSLFSADSVYWTAINAVASSSLMHIVVDTDETAKQILSRLISDKLGRTTFIPLNRIISSKSITYPSSEICSSNQGFPLISRLSYASQYESVMKEVFGKAFICASLEAGGLASKISKSFHLSCVTLDGDRIDKKGALTGGYASQKLNNRFSQLVAFSTLSSAITTLQMQIEAKNAILRDLDGQINDSLSEILKEENQIKKESLKLHELQSSLSSLKANGFQRLISQRQLELKQSESCVASLQLKIKSLNEELNSPFVEWNQQAFDQMNSSLASLNKQLTKLIKEQSNLNALKIGIEAEIDSNLLKRIALLEEEDSLSTTTQSFSSLLTFSSLADYDEKISKLTEESTRILSQSSQMRLNLQSLEKTLESQKNALQAAQSKLSSLSSSTSKITPLKAVLGERKERLSSSIKELGLVSSEAHSPHWKSLSQTEILSKLTLVNETIKQRFSHINKRAAEQYSSFLTQRKALLERKSELEQSSASIKAFITTLDAQKETTIMRTFDQVANHFSQIFSRLVPTGSGQLLLEREKNTAEGGLELTGVSIRVSFTSTSPDNSVLMSQLSGGQKSVVALALIFAIQRVDPAPFYLFDEIDANLDAVYREAVAQMVHELSREAQFITTTFRAEMIERADKFFGVQFVNRVSQIGPIEREVAKEFVETVR